MKHFIILLFLLFIFNSCQTTQPDDSELSLQQEEIVGDIVDGSEEVEETGEALDSSNNEGSDLESEFQDSEEFEKNLQQQAFPDSGDTVATTDDLQSEEEDDLDIEEDFAEQTKESAEGESAIVAGQQQEEEATLEEQESAPDSTDGFAESVQEIPESDPVSDSAQVDTEDTSAVVSDSELTQQEITTDETLSETASDIVMIQNIRYEAKENKIYIDGSSPFTYQSRENAGNNQLIIEIPNAVLAEALQERPFVMKDFDTQIALLQADQKDSNTVRVVLQMKENSSMPIMSASSDIGSLSISGIGGGVGGKGLVRKDNVGSMTADDTTVLPAKSLEDFFLSTPQFTGSPITITVLDADVKSVLQFIAHNTGLNLAIGDGVTGKVTMDLKEVPWDQALVTVMKMKKLGYVREGTVIRIMSLQSLKKDQEEIQKMLVNQKTLDPLRIKIMALAYAKASELSPQIKPFLSKRGQIVEDPKSNSLIITETDKTIEMIDTMVKNLDKPPNQVMIEAKIIEARENFSRQFGISFNIGLAPLPANALNISAGGNIEVFPGNVPSGSAMTSKFRIGHIAVGNLDATLGLSEADDLVNIISAPKIMVLNGESATITQSTETIDETTVTSDRDTTTSPQRVEAALTFEVTPEITALGSVFMKVKMGREFFGAPTGAQATRPKNSRNAETTVLVDNGQTIVIGGIYQKDESQANQGPPLLRHIPILNWFFSRSAKSQERNELLLFLTPKVIQAQRSSSTSAEMN